MDDESMTYCDNFFDDSVMVTNGYDCISNHILKTFSYVSTIQTLFEQKVAAEEELVKSYTKIVKNLSKNEHINDPTLKLVVEAMTIESEKRSKFCDIIKTSFIEDLKTLSKKQMELLKKVKNDVSFDIKNRKNHYDLANRACKNVNNKIKTHEQTFKKNYGTDMDEKIKLKFHKSQETIRQAGIELKVCAETLEMTLQKYIKNYKDFCCKVEKTDFIMIDLIRSGVIEISQGYSNFYKEVQECYNNLIVLPEETTGVEYCKRFVASDAKRTTFPAYTSIMESDESGRIEYSLELGVVFDENSTKSILDPSDLSLNNTSRVDQKVNSLKHKNSSSEVIDAPIEIQEGTVPPPPPPVKSSENQSRCDAIPEIKTPNIGDYVIAVYDFEGQNDDELSFKVGQKIKIINQEDDIWYLGELSNGKKGAFPLSYVE